MNKQVWTISLVSIGFLVLILAVSPVSGQGRANSAIQVYVTGQGLIYDSIILTQLPQKGPFQELVPGAGPDGMPATEFGPGDAGYLGGRWWVDVNGNGEQDEEDNYFMCPLLGPGVPVL